MIYNKIVTNDNQTITSENLMNLTVTWETNSETNIKPGSCVSTMVSGEVVGDYTDWEDVTNFTLYSTHDSDLTNATWTKVGVFYVQNTKPIGKNRFSIEAYDAICLLEKDLAPYMSTNYASLSPATTKTIYEIASAICTQCGVTLAPQSEAHFPQVGNTYCDLISIPMESFHNYENWDNAVISGRTFLSWLAELCCCYIVINPDNNKLYFTWYGEDNLSWMPQSYTTLKQDNVTVFSDVVGAITPSNTETFDATRSSVSSTVNGIPYKQGSMTFDKYTIDNDETIVNIKGGSGDILYSYVEDATATIKCSYTVEDNMFVCGYRSYTGVASDSGIILLLHRIHDGLAEMSYKPFSAQLFSVDTNMLSYAGTYIGVVDYSGNTFKTLVTKCVRGASGITISSTGDDPESSYGTASFSGASTSDSYSDSNMTIINFSSDHTYTEEELTDISNDIYDAVTKGKIVMLRDAVYDEYSEATAEVPEAKGYSYTYKYYNLVYAWRSKSYWVARPAEFYTFCITPIINHAYVADAVTPSLTVETNNIGIKYSCIKIFRRYSSNHELEMLEDENSWLPFQNAETELQNLEYLQTPTPFTDEHLNYESSYNITENLAKKCNISFDSGAPTTSTEGDVGDLYVNTDDGEMYHCTDDTGSVYTWAVIGSGGSGGTTNFNLLTNRPSYNGTTMTGSTSIPEVKTATWDGKQDALVSGTNIKTVNGTSLLGSGNITAIPTGGTAGQILSKVDAADYNAEWVNASKASHGIPSGGTAGQVLAKVDGTDYNTEWVNQSGGSSIPTVVVAASQISSETIQFTAGQAAVLEDSGNNIVLIDLSSYISSANWLYVRENAGLILQGYYVFWTIFELNTASVHELFSITYDSSTKTGLIKEFTIANGSALSSHTSDTSIHTTSSEKTTWNGKQDALVSGTSIKTVNGQSLLSSGNVEAIPSGGTTGQILAKVDGTDYNTEWIDPSAAGGAELSANKVTSWSATPNDTHYPSEKLVYDTIGDVSDLLDALLNGVS